MFPCPPNEGGRELQIERINFHWKESDFMTSKMHNLISCFEEPKSQIKSVDGGGVEVGMMMNVIDK